MKHRLFYLLAGPLFLGGLNAQTLDPVEAAPPEPINLTFPLKGPDADADFINFETPQVHPLDISPGGSQLAACNTPDGRVEIYALVKGLPKHRLSLSVGVDPVSVRYRSDDELWVVNQISDSISVISVSAAAVLKTIPTLDKPADVLFPPDSGKAFVTCGTDNAVLVYDLDNLDATPERLDILGEEPRALALSPDGKTVYAAIFESGNGTTVLAGGQEDEEMISYPPANVVSDPRGPYDGVNPPPNLNEYIVPRPPEDSLPEDRPRVSLVVKRDDEGRWMDDNNGDWSRFVDGDLAPLSGRPEGWELVDNDIAMIDVATHEISYASGLMNIGMALGVNPVSGEVAVVGTDAKNEVRYEFNLNTVFHEVVVGIVDPVTGEDDIVEDLNPQISGPVSDENGDPKSFSPKSRRYMSLGEPRGIVYHPDGDKAYVTGRGSHMVIVIDEDGNRLRPTNPIEVGKGPTGMVIDEDGSLLYVLNRFDNSISTVELEGEVELDTVSFHDPTPDNIKIGRHHFYDTQTNSIFGHASCASCHVDGKTDRLAWDLGNPMGQTTKVKTPVLFVDEEEDPAPEHHPMKGPMVTQTFQSMIGSDPFHWRGDIVEFEEFNMTFVNLIGRDTTLSNEAFNEFQAYLTSIAFPPNPFRTLENTLPEDLPLPGHFSTGRFSEAGTPLPNGNAEHGLELFKKRTHARLNDQTCFGCHQQTSGLGEILNPGSRSTGLTPFHFDGEESTTQIKVASVSEAHVTRSGHTLNALVGSQQKPFKVAQLRNLYDKSGFTTLPGKPSLSGFGFSHDGSVDSIERFVSLEMFDLKSDQEVADLTAMLLTFTGNNSTEVDRSSWSGQSFSSETHSATGTQVTVTSEPADEAVRLSSRLFEIAEQDEIDVVANSTMNGAPRGWLYMGNGVFQSDQATQGMEWSKLIRLSSSPVTLTAVHRGTGRRIGIDRDRDGLLDHDEVRDLAPLVPGIQNPFDPAEVDVSGDHYDVLPDGIPDQLNDFDGDGVTNRDEMNAGTNPIDNWVEDSNFRVYLTEGATPDVFYLNWPGRPFANYRVETSDDLKDWVAAPAGGISTEATEKILQYRVRERAGEGERKRYFRVVDLGAGG